MNKKTKLLQTISTQSNLYTVIKTIGTKEYYQKDEIIYFDGDTADKFFLIKSGRVRLFLTSIEGNELTLAILGENTVFGESSYFGNSPRLTSVSALTDVELFSVDLHMLMASFTDNPNLMVEMFALMAKRIHSLAAQVYNMNFFSADKKVAYILVHLGTYFKKEISNNYSIDYTHEDISRLIGTARTTTTKVLKLFEQKGWISLAYKNIIVLNEDSLKEYLLS
jgi:CRP/FNR family transcriptional regulator, cyclic AMP receptor protein